MSDSTKRFRELQAEGAALFRAKNADYGDSFKEDGMLGVMIRAKDKLNRFVNLARKEGERAVKSEALRETLMDLSNYSLMAIMAHEDGGGWRAKGNIEEDPMAKALGRREREIEEPGL